MYSSSTVCSLAEFVQLGFAAACTASVAFLILSSCQDGHAHADAGTSPDSSALAPAEVADAPLAAPFPGDATMEFIDDYTDDAVAPGPGGALNAPEPGGAVFVPGTPVYGGPFITDFDII
jgi:hypothetical protein